jgi:hypothetical protein
MFNDNVHTYIGTFKCILISAQSIPSAACPAPPEDEKMLETCRGYYINS